MHERDEERFGEMIQIPADIGGLRELLCDEADECIQFVGGRQHDVGEEVLFVGEVLVHGLLGDPGAHGDLLHRGALVPPGEERPDGRFTDLTVAAL